MSEENKKSKKHHKHQKEEKPVEEKAEKKEERTPGARGEVGTATPALTIRQKWHEAHFKRVSADDKHNPTKRLWVPNGGAPSLKKFARELLKTGDPVAKEWFANKKGDKNLKRSDANIKAQREAAMASKAARKKSKSGGGGKASKDAAPATAAKK